ncbi:MgtC/SapB family protein [Caldimonas tepidiphila]|uniref:MgtC/SapB family protein n=1 Tax=Caldimonas tepidiphila TaxID=2315841 RepID=UPI000E5A74B4|nr:MgtC/SapB family protein [Caldimonas tepidiphila]
MWQAIVETVRDEFSDVPDVAELTRLTVRLLMALVLGAMIGYERERRGSAAGLRTHMLVSLGTAVFVLVPLQAGMKIEDLSRVIQGVISGIGFLGAGAVLKLDRSQQIRGLTTAAGIWATSAIGMTAGMGLEATAVFVTVLSIVVLDVLLRVEKALIRRGWSDAPRQPPER